MLPLKQPGGSGCSFLNYLVMEQGKGNKKKKTKDGISILVLLKRLSARINEKLEVWGWLQILCQGSSENGDGTN